MKIVKITKTGLFYKVKFDDEQVYKFHESIIIDYRFLKKGTEVSKEKLDKAISDNNYYLALDKGISYLTTLHSKKEVELYLKRYFEDDVISKVILKLEELKLINDKEFAQYYVDVYKRKHYGCVKIKNDLFELGVSSIYIEEALESYSIEEAKEHCQIHFEKYYPKVKNSSKLGAKNKITNYLVAKGFTSNIISQVLNDNNALLGDAIDEDKAIVIAYKKLLKSRKQTINDRDFKNKVIRSLSNKGFPLYKILKLIEGGIEYD